MGTSQDEATSLGENGVNNVVEIGNVTSYSSSADKNLKDERHKME